MRVSDQNGSWVCYRLHRNGEPVLLVHGLGGSGADWALQIPALEHRFRVVVPDLPGRGSSKSMRSTRGRESAQWVHGGTGEKR
jgi:3-oxoadipate enol-lactonase